MRNVGLSLLDIFHDIINCWFRVWKLGGVLLRHYKYPSIRNDFQAMFKEIQPHCDSPRTKSHGLGPSIEGGRDERDENDGHDDGLLGNAEENNWLGMEKPSLEVEAEEVRDFDDERIIEISESDPLELDEGSLPVMDVTPTRGKQAEPQEDYRIEVDWKQ
ncbi:hypothetical protein BGZ80_000807 [Entomortierella chlamydospora]|uniref:Uncharacterized protein n=1 Tax=Entomortierella chlamydospora TaxID=101097 RepID=A0A9P6MRN0_9FUNG|nr:hypothetical protein BGZ80_000807 [Entomortierella chlamydospora]